MKQVLYLLPALIFAVYGAGCNLNNIQELQSDGSRVSECNLLDYGIEEFNLKSSIPMISNSYNINVSVEQIGDCSLDSLAISLYENNVLITKNEIKKPVKINPITIDWIPRHDIKTNLRVELEVMDSNLKNNHEEINVSGVPIGNYMHITDLTSEVIKADSLYAEMFKVESPLSVTLIDAYLAKSDIGQTSTTLNIKILMDDNGKPGQAVFAKEESVELSDQFGWVAFKVDKTLSPGSYWLAISGSGTDTALWHYNRKPYGGGMLVVMEPDFEINSSTMMLSDDQWILLPEKDFSFKVHAGGGDE